MHGPSIVVLECGLRFVSPQILILQVRKPRHHCIRDVRVSFGDVPVPLGFPTEELCDLGQVT